jgi:hypothetical protein
VLQYCRVTLWALLITSKVGSGTERNHLGGNHLGWRHLGWRHWDGDTWDGDTWDGDTGMETLEMDTLGKTYSRPVYGGNDE